MANQIDERVKPFEVKMGKSIASLDSEFGTIRAGRANPHVLDRITVDYYGTPTPLQQVANISVPEARMIQIQPWESSMIKAIEKAILATIKPTEVPLDQLNARAKHALMGNLGIQYTYASEDRVEATMPVDERTRQPFGILHGGATLALAETVAGLGSMILAKPDEMVVGMQVSGSHMSSAHEGDTVRAVGTIIHKGRSSHVWNVDIFTSTDKLVSSVRVINSILKKK